MRTFILPHEAQRILTQSFQIDSAGSPATGESRCHGTAARGALGGSSIAAVDRRIFDYEKKFTLALKVGAAPGLLAWTRGENEARRSVDGFFLNGNQADGNGEQEAVCGKAGMARRAWQGINCEDQTQAQDVTS